MKSNFNRQFQIGEGPDSGRRKHGLYCFYCENRSKFFKSPIVVFSLNLIELSTCNYWCMYKAWLLLTTKLNIHFIADSTLPSQPLYSSICFVKLVFIIFISSSVYRYTSVNCSYEHFEQSCSMWLRHTSLAGKWNTKQLGNQKVLSLTLNCSAFALPHSPSLHLHCKAERKHVVLQNSQSRSSSLRFSKKLRFVTRTPISWTFIRWVTSRLIIWRISS